MPDDARELTEDEVRARFLAHARAIAKYWSDDSREPDATQRVYGAVFSLLAALDGESAEIPGFKVIPNPHPDDQAFHASRGECWYPDDVDIAGALHEQFYERS